jgi:hypothetical protein
MERQRSADQSSADQNTNLCNAARVSFLVACLAVLAPSLCRCQIPEGVAVGTIASSNTVDLAATGDVSSAAVIPVAIHASQPSLIVVGFAGGFVRSTSSIHGEVGLAMHLREQYGSTIHTEIFENHHGDDAYREILRLVSVSKKAVPAKKPVKIILYGHSWGASEAVTVARRLERDGVPVLLVVQVDGVQKPGEDADLIPANVAQAVNFYQTDGFLHGRPTIRAANPATTTIIGNFRMSYKDKGIACPGYPWYTRLFTKPHIEIENDPQVWNKVEALIVARATP